MASEKELSVENLSEDHWLVLDRPIPADADPQLLTAVRGAAVVCQLELQLERPRFPDLKKIDAILTDHASGSAPNRLARPTGLEPAAFTRRTFSPIDSRDSPMIVSGLMPVNITGGVPSGNPLSQEYSPSTSMGALHAQPSPVRPRNTTLRPPI
jgi:hypothetical protein